ncbi:hypothetical protein [Pedobacter sandarakinus]|uniref:hypothetical protein n=1 Tax=Pedobacter sandarakinus TaxID=353156 RepID=UPI002245D413|nr:hypothetical protein [Pedobacter sandarakinus]MCX2573599.1 hypothetical protein [Pedobacter sandarakinus]
MKNLTKDEMTTTNGGGSFNQQGGFGISFTASAESLLNLTFTRTYGDRESTTNLSIGNDIDVGSRSSGASD